MRCRVQITDLGKGLSEIDISKLFTSFVRLDEKNEVEGTGLGLVITKHMVDLMDGNIGVKSTLGKGTTFWVDIPLSEVQYETR